GRRGEPRRRAPGAGPRRNRRGRRRHLRRYRQPDGCAGHQRSPRRAGAERPPLPEGRRRRRHGTPRDRARPGARREAPVQRAVEPAGGTLTCILQWNDPFGAAADDYDLVLLDADLNVVAESIDPQVGAQDPIEAVAVVNQTDTDQLANVLVQRFAGAPRRLELFCLGAAAMEHGTATGSIFGHAALSSVVAVGAMNVHDP